MNFMIRDNWLIDILISASILTVCVLAYKKQALTILAAAFAFVISIFLYISGGILFLAPMLGFFISSTFITRIKTREKEELEKVLYEKGGRRDHMQVLANGGAAFIMASIYYLFPGKEAIIALFCALAACNADTWASEIGIMSNSKPFSIISFRQIQRGMSGGVTFLGLFASCCGAVFIAGIYFVFMFLSMPFLELLLNCTIISVFGFSGSIIDSALGATIQPAYLDGSTGKLTEKRFAGDIRNKKVKGLEFFSNDMVNFVSSLLAACLAYAVLIVHKGI